MPYSEELVEKLRNTSNCFDRNWGERTTSHSEELISEARNAPDYADQSLIYAMERLAVDYFVCRELDKCRRLQEELVQLTLKTLGENHATTKRAKRNLRRAKAAVKTGRYFMDGC